MKRVYVRSSLFNLAFYGWTALGCVIFLPCLLLPRKYFVGIVYVWICGVTFLEKTILNLHYEVRGKEFLPATGSYIVAAKHQSPYETIKLRILFKDPAIVLKKELLSIPFWGWYLNKSDVISIDRSTPDQAFKSFEAGTRYMKSQGRPIVIFPQGTRVDPHETPIDKPYRSGVARVEAGTQLPIIPMALNSGMFWPRKGWLKSSGIVVFEFLKPVTPGLEKQQIMQDLQTRLETSSNKLSQEALTKNPPRNRSGVYAAAFFALCFIAYTILWITVAAHIKTSYLKVMQDIGGNQRDYTHPLITGYPGPIKVYIAKDTLVTDKGALTMKNVNLRGWPIPLTPIHIRTGSITVQAAKWENPLLFESLTGDVTYFNRMLIVKRSALKKNNFTARITGRVNLQKNPVPEFDMDLSLDNYQDLLLELAQLKIIKPKNVFLTAAALGMFAKDGIAHIPLKQKGGTLYAGPLAVASLPVLSRRAPGNPPVPDR